MQEGKRYDFLETNFDLENRTFTGWIEIERDSEKNIGYCFIEYRLVFSKDFLFIEDGEQIARNDDGHIFRKIRYS